MFSKKDAEKLTKVIPSSIKEAARDVGEQLGVVHKLSIDKDAPVHPEKQEALDMCAAASLAYCNEKEMQNFLNCKGHEDCTSLECLVSENQKQEQWWYDKWSDDNVVWTCDSKMRSKISGPSRCFGVAGKLTKLEYFTDYIPPKKGGCGYCLDKAYGQACGRPDYNPHDHPKGQSCLAFLCACARNKCGCQKHTGETGIDGFHGFYQQSHRSEEKVVIMFRGTEALKYSDWESNFNFNELAPIFTDDKKKEVLKSARKRDGCENTVMIHMGFREQFMRFWDGTPRTHGEEARTGGGKSTEKRTHRPRKDWLTEQLKDGKKELLITGHSLGGSLASVAAVFLGMEFPKTKIRLFTFGSPRVGNRAFYDVFNENKNVIASYRFRAAYDPVPVSNSVHRCCNSKGTTPDGRDKWLVHLPGGGERMTTGIPEGEFTVSHWNDRIFRSNTSINSSCTLFSKVLAYVFFDYSSAARFHTIDLYHDKIGHWWKVDLNDVYRKQRWQKKYPSKLSGCMWWTALIFAIAQVYFTGDSFMKFTEVTTAWGNNIFPSMYSTNVVEFTSGNWTISKDLAYTPCIRRGTACNEMSDHSTPADPNWYAYESNPSGQCPRLPGFELPDQYSDNLAMDMESTCCPPKFSCFTDPVTIGYPNVTFGYCEHDTLQCGKLQWCAQFMDLDGKCESAQCQDMDGIIKTVNNVFSATFYSLCISVFLLCQNLNRGNITKMRVLRYNYYLSWIASQLDTACKFFTLYTFATVGTKISFLDELEQNKCFDDKTGLLDIASLPNTLKGIEVDMAFSFALRAFATIHSLLKYTCNPPEDRRKETPSIPLVIFLIVFFLVSALLMAHSYMEELLGIDLTFGAGDAVDKLINKYSSIA